MSDWIIVNSIKKGPDETLSTDVASIENNKSVELYPNPFKTTFSLKLDQPGQVKGISVYYMMGRLVETVLYSNSQDIYSLGNDLNIVKVNGLNEVNSIKIIKE